MISLYIPSHNDSHLVEESVASTTDWPRVIIWDNESRDYDLERLHALQAKYKNVHLVDNEPEVSRVENWSACVQDFVVYQDEDETPDPYPWMRFLAAGNKMIDGSYAICCSMLESCPDAKLVQTAVLNVWKHTSALWRLDAQPMKFDCPKVMMLAAEKGNIFHSLGAFMVHADALKSGYTFGGGMFDWAADFAFALDLATRYPLVGFPRATMEMIYKNRQSIQKMINTPTAITEETYLRMRAAQCYGLMTADWDTATKLEQAGRKFLLEQLA